MPTVNVKETLESAAEEIFNKVHGGFVLMPSNATPEMIWTAHAELVNSLIGLYNRVLQISESLSPDASYVAPSSTLNMGEHFVPDRLVIDGLVRYVRYLRQIAFKKQTDGLPSPIKNTDPHSVKRALHEMVFVPTDCFIDLSFVAPGEHGLLFAFRDELTIWLLSTVLFNISYDNFDGRRIHFGIFKALELVGANMTGPEFEQLSNETREIIVTHMSRSNRGSEKYKTMYRDLALSLRTLPCILLQCVELPSGMYPNLLVAPGAVPVPELSSIRPKLSLPPMEVGQEVVASEDTSNRPVNADSAHDSNTRVASPGLPAPPHASSASTRIIQTGSSKAPDHQRTKQLHIKKKASKPSRANNNNTPRAPQRRFNNVKLPIVKSLKPVPAAHVQPVSAGPAHHHNDGRWYGVGNPDNQPRGAMVGDQNWLQHQHQNNNLINFVTNPQQVVPPIPLQSSTRNNQPNPQYNPRHMLLPNAGFAFPPKNSRGPAPSRTRNPAQAHPALYGPPQMRGHFGNAFPNQNIDPAWIPAGGGGGIGPQGFPLYQTNGIGAAPSFVGPLAVHPQASGAFPPMFQPTSHYYGRRM